MDAGPVGGRGSVAVLLRHRPPPAAPIDGAAAHALRRRDPVPDLDVVVLPARLCRDLHHRDLWLSLARALQPRAGGGRAGHDRRRARAPLHRAPSIRARSCTRPTATSRRRSWRWCSRSIGRATSSRRCTWRRRRRWRSFSTAIDRVWARSPIVLAALLALSTMTTKQHFIADVISGYALAFAARALCSARATGRGRDREQRPTTNRLPAAPSITWAPARPGELRAPAGGAACRAPRS